MPKLVPIKPRKLIKILIKLGFFERDAEGSHHFFKHKDGRTTVIPVHNRDLSRGLLRKILNDIQVSVEKYDKLRNSENNACVYTLKDRSGTCSHHGEVDEWL